MRIRLYTRGSYGLGKTLTTTGKWRITKGIGYCSLSLECSFEESVKKPTPWWKWQQFEKKTTVGWFDEDDLILYVDETFINECTGGCDE